METLKIISGKEHNNTVTLDPPVKVSICIKTTVLHHKYRFVCTSKMYFNYTFCAENLKGNI